jgi:HSP20 family protein
MRDDDRDDPFDEFFQEIERMMNEMMGESAEFHVQHGGGSDGQSDEPEHDVHVDVHEADDELRVVADVPGVEKEDIDLRCDGESLTIDAAGANREYRERIALPTTVDEHSAGATYNNGILEVTFDPVADPGSTSIDI